MNKKELCAKVAARSGLTKKEAARIIALTLDTLTDALSSGEDVRLVGFGSFEVRERAARKARDFESGESACVEVPPTKSVRFRPSQTLKDKVSG